ncbi:MAG: hypothetical protein U5L10_05850 [Candidatus Moranbacteria bacterium]|nr:hypothetical protein [Candidatus Moranbacteria bacterium]
MAREKDRNSKIHTIEVNLYKERLLLIPDGSFASRANQHLFKAKMEQLLKRLIEKERFLLFNKEASLREYQDVINNFLKKHRLNFQFQIRIVC